MTKHEMIVCILLAIVTTNLIRILPMVLIKGRIQNVFLRSFLYYVPYVTLAVMTFPAIVESTMSPYAGIAALLIGLVAAWRRLGLFPVACICCAVAYLIDAWLA
jgi:branched-subunit amino acid transport protein